MCGVCGGEGRHTQRPEKGIGSPGVGVQAIVSQLAQAGATEFRSCAGAVRMLLSHLSSPTFSFEE